MRKNTKMKLLLIVGVIASVSATATAARLKPVMDYDEALALSGETGKPVLLDFYFDT